MKPLPLLLALALSLAACGGTADTAVPRPVAYPRIAVCDSLFRPVGGLPVNIEVNAGAVAQVDSVRPDGSVWLTVSYPAYGGAKLYLTLSHATPEVIANRSERLSMNTGGAPTQLTTVVSAAGFESSVALTPAGSAIPVQILSTDGGWALSGAFVLEAAASAPDSVRPVVEAVRSDLIHAAKKMR